METMYVFLPLFNDAYYEYTTSLERVAYKIRIAFNERMQAWTIDLRYADGEPIILGEALVPNYPLFFDYVTELTGYFYLQPIGSMQNETISNPLDLFRYYQFMYVYDEEIEEEE